MVARPVAGRLAGAAVDDELLGMLGHLGVEVVLQHAQRCLGLPAAGGQRAAAGCADLGHGPILLAVGGLAEDRPHGDCRGRDRRPLGRPGRGHGHPRRPVAVLVPVVPAAQRRLPRRPRWRRTARALRDQAAASPPPGVLAYDDDGEPAGWCAVAPRAAYPRLATSTLRDHAGRGRAVGGHLLRRAHRRAPAGAGRAAARRRGRAGPPARRPSRSRRTRSTSTVKKPSSSELYHGPLSVFLRAGFTEVGDRPKPARTTVRLALGPVAGIRGVSACTGPRVSQRLARADRRRRRRRRTARTATAASISGDR